MRLYKGPKQNFISSFHFPINCLAHTAPKRKRKNCTENPFCIHRLGLELLDKLSESLKAPKVLVRRDSSRQPCGLTNAGNFCYVNNFFQTWFNDLKFRQCIYNWRPSENWTKPPTARLDIEATMNCLQQLFITMQFTPFESTDAGAFIELLRLDDRQQDTDPGRHSAFSESHQPDNFLCKLQSDERDGRRRSRTANRLISAIQSFFAPEPLTDYRCEQCELRGRVTRTANFTQLPEVLIIQLTRYVVGSNGRVRKLPHAVQYPRILAGHDLQQDVVGAADYKLCKFQPTITTPHSFSMSKSKMEARTKMNRTRAPPAEDSGTQHCPDCVHGFRHHLLPCPYCIYCLRTLYYLDQGKIHLREEVKVFTLAFHRFPNLAQQGARDFAFWHWAQIQFKNPHVQFIKLEDVCVTPFVLAFLGDGREVVFDLECRTRVEISDAIIGTLGKTDIVRKREQMDSIKRKNPAQFGANCERQCICEMQGQHPCTALMYAPRHLRGSWRWNHPTYNADKPMPYPPVEGYE
uniref:Small ribosomal subunit protein mS25 n=1 Tax=Globodera rostochiensis TaxID=31243 RepID=A0A914I8Q5_GLORO